MRSRHPWFVVLQIQLPRTADLLCPSHTSTKLLLPLIYVTGFLDIFHPPVGYGIIVRQSLSLEQDLLILAVQSAYYQEQCWCNPERDAHKEDKASAQGSCGNAFSSGQSSSTPEGPPKTATAPAHLTSECECPCSTGCRDSMCNRGRFCTQMLAGSATKSNSVSARRSSFHALSVLKAEAAVVV